MNRGSRVLNVKVGETLHDGGRSDDGRVSVPWSDIVVDMKLPQRVAA